MIVRATLLLSLITAATQNAAQVFTCRDVKAGIYSEAPLENIEATSDKGYSVLNTGQSEVQFSIPVNTFRFKKSLMQEHFNENYMESDKYPNAQFKGKINEKINVGQEGEFPVTVTGDLMLHGVKKLRTISGKITVSKIGVTLNSTFEVACKDHQIKIPSVVFKNIAETIKVTISARYQPYIPPNND